MILQQVRQHSLKVQNLFGYALLGHSFPHRTKFVVQNKDITTTLQKNMQPHILLGQSKRGMLKTNRRHILQNRRLFYLA